MGRWVSDEVRFGPDAPSRREAEADLLAEEAEREYQQWCGINNLDPEGGIAAALYEQEQ